MVSDVHTGDREDQTPRVKKGRQGREFLLFPEFKVSCSFEPARLDLSAVVVPSQKMRVKITGGEGGVISAKLVVAAPVPPL